ncbi:hypothetical protein PFNF135_04060 [Plasmodium falciparum NF135/5.C10]|uniref:Uncharacterized protein n=1 Tax=Plasmodium falciparum NF135/5.C10 TaxID=1036726 RepID=W4ICJ4_PLAFA|nr:hypothetical protein PFNF135_04060 [Plasmodium falciparum NF135/5.C10]
MKLDKKKDFKKKLVTCLSLLQVGDPLKIIVDETFIKLCILHKISIKEELVKLMNRQIILMTTKCISHNARNQPGDEEASYAIRKLTHYKCNHNEENLKKNDVVDIYVKKMKLEEYSKLSKNNYFANQLTLTHNFDSLYNIKNKVYQCDVLKNDNVESFNNNKDKKIVRQESDLSNIHDNTTIVLSNDVDLNTNDNVTIENSNDDDTNRNNIDSLLKINDNNMNTINHMDSLEEHNSEIHDKIKLNDSMKCIIDLVKNNNFLFIRSFFFFFFLIFCINIFQQSCHFIYFPYKKK